MLEEEGKNKTKTTKAKLLKAKARFTPDIFVDINEIHIYNPTFSVADLAG